MRSLRRPMVRACVRACLSCLWCICWLAHCCLPLITLARSRGVAGGDSTPEVAMFNTPAERSADGHFFDAYGVLSSSSFHLLHFGELFHYFAFAVTVLRCGAWQMTVFHGMIVVTNSIHGGATWARYASGPLLCTVHLPACAVSICFFVMDACMLMCRV